MKHHPIRRLIMALAIVTAVWTGAAAPASAVVVSPTVTGGVLDVTNSLGGGAQAIPLSGTSGSCPAMDLDVDLTSSTMEVTTLDIRGEFSFSGGTYVAVLGLLGSNQASVSGSSPATISGLTVDVQVDMYASAGSCSLGSIVCTGGISIDLSGSFSGNPGSPAAGKTFSLVGQDNSGFQTAGTCQAPFASYIDGHVSISSSPLTAVI